MERVKNLNDLMIPDDMVLVKIVEKKSAVLSPSDKPTIDYCVITLVGKDVIRYKEGDIVLKMSMGTLDSESYKGDNYALVPEVLLRMVVSPDNFAELPKESKLILQ